MFVFAVVDNCQRRWRNLRENYVKSHKKKPSGSGADGKNVDIWILDALSFLDDYVSHRRFIFKFQYYRIMSSVMV